MRTVVQRVSSAGVTLPRSGDISGQITTGLAVLVGLQRGDSQTQLQWMADKITNLRIFPDHEGKMNLDVSQVPGGAILLVPNFTVGCEVGKGRRPSFDRAMSPADAKPMFHAFVDTMRATGIPIQTGVFGAEMRVTLCNDGPVTFVIQTPDSSTGARQNA